MNLHPKSVNSAHSGAPGPELISEIAQKSIRLPKYARFEKWGSWADSISSRTPSLTVNISGGGL
jgi:hypothetical protein